jgi:IS1 family transposase
MSKTPKQRAVPTAKAAPLDAADAWTWTAICADTKLVFSVLVGDRDAHFANAFMDDVASHLSNRVQLTSDGHKSYLNAVEGAFGADVDFAQLVKQYGPAPSPPGRYSPAVCTGTRLVAVEGNPDPKHISTSYVERQNLTMRMHMRRFTRLTNGFSKKLENHANAIALHFAYYNFVRIHQTLRMTPAMAAGVTDKLWEMADLVLSWKRPTHRLGGRGATRSIPEATLDNPAFPEVIALASVFGIALLVSLASGRTLTIGGVTVVGLVDRKTQPALYWAVVGVYAAMFALLGWFCGYVVFDSLHHPAISN